MVSSALRIPMTFLIRLISELPDRYPIAGVMLLTGGTAMFQPRYIFSGRMLQLSPDLVTLYGMVFIFCGAGLLAVSRPSSDELKLWCSPLVIHTLGVTTISLVYTSVYIVSGWYLLSLYFTLKYIYLTEKAEAKNALLKDLSEISSEAEALVKD